MNHASLNCLLISFDLCFVHTIAIFFVVGDLLQFLWKRKPKLAFCVVGITTIELCPEDSWDFGHASLYRGKILLCNS